MSKASILKMALEEIARGVKKVDLGDLTRKPNVAARVQAVKRIAGDAGKKVASKVDDWGWKGGKPGEVTGSEAWNTSSKTKQIKFLKQIKEAFPDLVPYDPDNKLLQPSIKRHLARTIANPFRRMEQADLSRDYTGKLYKALQRGEYGDVDPEEAFRAAKTLRTLEDPDQSETFLALLPDWSGSLDELADAARKL